MLMVLTLDCTCRVEGLAYRLLGVLLVTAISGGEARLGARGWGFGGLGLGRLSVRLPKP